MGLLLDSFNEDVEKGRYVVLPLTRPQATTSGESTRQSEPPIKHIGVPFPVWDSFATAALRTMRERGYFSNERSPKWNDSRYVEVEGDVAEASSLHLLYAVDSVLCKYLSSPVRFLCQHTVKVDNHSVRADRIWGLGYPNSINLFGYFAILDFKRPTLINTAEFGSPMTWGKYCAMSTVIFREPDSTGSATILLKQAVGYSRRYGIKFVAFFDWQTLVLIVLAAAEETQGGDYCFITVVTERHMMRRALLGFLIRAHNAKMVAVDDYADILGGPQSAKKSKAPPKSGGFFSSGSGGESSRRRR